MVYVFFQLSVGPKRKKGIYLREPHQVAAPLVTSVSVNPTLHDRAGAAPGDGNAERVNMQMRIKLSTTAPSWVQCPDNLVLMHGGRSFEVRVDASQLASGQAHYAEVLGVDEAHPEAGPVRQRIIIIFSVWRDSYVYTLRNECFTLRITLRTDTVTHALNFNVRF